jgi:hypothetical protein
MRSACAGVRSVMNTGRVLVLTLVVLAVALLPLAVLTALGAHQRGLGMPGAVCSGLFFPVSWLVWYVKDERPYGRGHRPAV